MQQSISSVQTVSSKRDFIKCSLTKNTLFSARHNPSLPSVLQSALLFSLIISLCLSFCSFCFLLCLFHNLKYSFPNTFFAHLLSSSHFLTFYFLPLSVTHLVMTTSLFPSSKKIVIFVKRSCELIKYKEHCLGLCLDLYLHLCIYVCLYCHLPVCVSSAPRHTAHLV